MNVDDIDLNFLTPFFEPKLVAEMKNVGSLKTAKVGETIMDIGQYIKFIPLVVKGSLKVLRENENGEELFMYYINTGDTCSMSLTCCLQNRISGLKAVAEEDLEFLAIPISFLEEWIKNYASWRTFIFKSYQIRFDEMINTIDSLAFKKMDERLREYLVQKAEHANGKIIQTTHQEIATDLHASREAISRLLKKMELDKKIVLGRNKIEILED